MTKTTKAFHAVRPGKIYPETIPAGEDVDGRLAEIAVQLGCLDQEKPKAAPKTKAATKGAPENKAS
jgi:hypothetical protein